MTELEKMLAGKIYDCNDDVLVELREKAHKLNREYNNLDDSDERRAEILKALIPNQGKGVYLQGPIQFDYGCFTTMGENVFANFNFTVLDTCPVTIGDNVYFGPGCSILTPIHPMRYQDRFIFKNARGQYTDNEFGRPITIKDNCWIGGNVTICGGVTIGSGVVIGAGSVVVKDIPDNVFAAGNPCKVIRPITEEDGLENHPELY